MPSALGDFSRLNPLESVLCEEETNMFPTDYQAPCGTFALAQPGQSELFRRGWGLQLAFRVFEAVPGLVPGGGLGF